jgi:hypothetical protein
MAGSSWGENVMTHYFKLQYIFREKKWKIEEIEGCFKK